MVRAESRVLTFLSQTTTCCSLGVIHSLPPLFRFPVGGSGAPALLFQQGPRPSVPLALTSSPASGNGVGFEGTLG